MILDELLRKRVQIRKSFYGK